MFSSDGRRFLWAALGVGLLVRLVILFHTATLQPGIVDEQHYIQIARNILDGYGFAWVPGRPTSIRPPLYPWLLSVIFSVAGRANFQAVRILQLVFALLTTGGVYLLGRLAFDARVGRYAAALFWLYPSLIFFNFVLLTETLFTMLVVAFAVLAVALIQTPRSWIALSCGVALGLGALTRSVLWPFPFLFCPALALLLKGSLRTRLALPALVLAGYSVAVVPWAVRNTRLQGTLTVIDSMDGQHFRMGNYENTPDERMWAGAQNSHEENWGEQAARETGQRVTEGSKDQWALRKAVTYIVTHPGITLRRSMIRFADFWGIEREFVAGVQEGLFSPPRWFVAAGAVAIGFGYVAIVILGAAGIWLHAPTRRAHMMLLLPVLAITGAHTLAFGHSRYHIPLIPILCLYGAALLSAREPIAWRRYRPALVGAAISITIFISIWVRQIVTVDGARIRQFLQQVAESTVTTGEEFTSLRAENRPIEAFNHPVPGAFSQRRAPC